MYLNITNVVNVKNRTLKDSDVRNCQFKFILELGIYSLCMKACCYLFETLDRFNSYFKLKLTTTARKYNNI